MKKVISLFLVMILLTGMLTVSFSALSVSDTEDGVPLIKSFKEGLAEYEESEEMEPGSLPTQRVYFQMPNGQTGPTADEDVNLHHPEEIDEETGEVIKEAYDEVVIHAGEKAPSWYNEHNVLDGKNYAGIYWWGGPAATDGAWVGYRMEIENYEQGIYYVDLPYDPDDDSPDKNVATAIFNNGVDGGTDSTKPIYYKAAQTVDTNVQGAWEGDYDSLPYGSPDEWSFDNCIYVIDPNQVSINAFSQKQTCGANWYVYYGNGCYGEEYEDGSNYSPTPGWSDNVADICKNPDHFNAQGVHVGYQGGDTPHTHTPAEAVQENVTAATYKAGGSYDSVVYCSECGEEISRETINTDPIALDPAKLYFDTNGTGWEMGSKNKVAFHIFGGDITNGQAWGAKKEIGSATAGQDGLFEFDPSKISLTFNEGVQYKIIFVRTEGNNWSNQTYDLLFTVDCFGHVAFCDGTEYENPVDSSKKTLAAFWYGMDADTVGPVKQISSIGNVVGTCLEAGTTDESLFNDFLTVIDDTTGMTKYQNAYKFVVEANIKTEQQMIDDIGTALGLTKQQIYDAFINSETETDWDYTVSTLPGEVTPVHVHTPGEPVQENIRVTHDATYCDMVTYCTGCGEELSRVPAEDPIITHTLTLVPEVPATENATGTKAHYMCSGCDKLFQDATGTIEATAAWLIIPKLDHTHTPGQPVSENIVPATCTAEGSFDEVVYCTSCGAEISREHKTVGMVSHALKRVNGKNPTETEDGWEGHWQCTVCGKRFGDAAGTNEVTWEQIVKPKLQPAVTGKLGDADESGEVDIIDVTVIQRVLANINPATDVINKLGDVDKNNELEIIDATLIQRWLLGLEQDRGIGADV